MTLMVYNALSRQKETFKPLREGRVYMYVCGPTVYDHAHVGHAKTYVSFDVMVRYLRWRGYTVRYVQNITDVGHLLDSGEDRILKRAARERVEPMEQRRVEADADVHRIAPRGPRLLEPLARRRGLGRTQSGARNGQQQQREHDALHRQPTS